MSQARRNGEIKERTWMAAFSLICMAKSTASTAPSEIITKRLVSVGKGHEYPSVVVVNFFW